MLFRVVLALLITATSCFSQQLKLRLEAGVNSGGFPKSYNMGDSRVRALPLVRPVLGIHLVGESRIGLFVSVSARYFTTGLREKLKKDGIDPIYNTPFRHREDEKFLFTRLSYGAGVGYKLPILRQKVSVMGGYRFIYHPSGSYSYSYSYQDGLGFSNQFEKGYDPFSDTNLDVRARRNGHEIYFAATYDFNKRFGGIIQYSFPTDVIFAESGGHTSSYSHAYVRNDMNVSVIYRIR